MPRKPLDNEKTACQDTLPGIIHAKKKCSDFRMGGAGDASTHVVGGSLSRGPWNK